MEHTNLKSWADDDRPRERLLQHGAAALSDVELLAILLRTGTRQQTVVELAREMLHSVQNNLDELGKLGVSDLCKNFKGIGQTKAVTLLAALELGRRRKAAESLQRPQMCSSIDINNFFQPKIADLPHEEFWLMTMNRNRRVIATHCLSKGGVSTTAVDVKMVLKTAIDQLASCIAICHNHPSGNINPSEQDVQLTQKIDNACRQLDIKLLDHIIIGGKKYYSFADNGLI